VDVGGKDGPQLIATTSRRRPAIAGGTIASKNPGRAKCIVPVNVKKAASAARERLIAQVSRPGRGRGGRGPPAR
jgi:hypothetical protein